MPRTAEQLDQIREGSREKILSTALSLFARHGYASTSVRMIAEGAGISQGLMYNYYESKQALLRAIFERSMDDVGASLAQAEASTPREGLEMLVRSAFATVHRNRLVWQLSYKLRMQPDALADLGERLHFWSETIRSRIEQLLQSAGWAEAATEARVLFAAIDGAAQHYVLDPERYPLERVAERIVLLFVPPAAHPPRVSPGHEEQPR